METGSGIEVLKGKKILVIDDDEAIADYLKVLLSAWGCRVSFYANGEGAFDAVQKEEPDVILMDVMLPDVDGITLCRRLRSNPDTLRFPVIMLTSLTDLTVVRDSLEQGALDYLSKPFSEKSLREKLEKVLVGRS